MYLNDVITMTTCIEPEIPNIPLQFFSCFSSHTTYTHLGTFVERLFVLFCLRDAGCMLRIDVCTCIKSVGSGHSWCMLLISRHLPADKSGQERLYCNLRMIPDSDTVASGSPPAPSSRSHYSLHTKRRPYLINDQMLASRMMRGPPTNSYFARLLWSFQPKT